MGDERINISLKAMSQSGRKILNVLGIKEEHYWDFVEVDKLIVQYFITKLIWVIMYFISYWIMLMNMLKSC